jgi:hypothetical protein
VSRFSIALPKAAFASASLLSALSLWNGSLCSAQTPDISKAFTFSTFTVPNAVTLSVESVNDAGTISGEYYDSSNNLISFTRSKSGTITPYTEPQDTTSPTFTNGGQINRAGAIAGEFYDTTISTYIGFIYSSSEGTYTTYQVPNQPSDTTTGLSGINDRKEICGFVDPPPYTTESSFIESGGAVTTFAPSGASISECVALNDSGTAVGYYQDSAGVDHGFMRTSSGTITTIDVPGAATTPGTAPCVTGSVAGTVPLGINRAGYVSGHYWDTSYNEHGFLMTPAGKFYQINVPGAYQTSGGGLNDKEEVVGHYAADSSCSESGYIATP